MQGNKARCRDSSKDMLFQLGVAGISAGKNLKDDEGVEFETKMHLPGS